MSLYALVSVYNIPLVTASLKRQEAEDLSACDTDSGSYFLLPSTDGQINVGIRLLAAGDC